MPGRATRGDGLRAIGSRPEASDRRATPEPAHDGGRAVRRASARENGGVTQEESDPQYRVPDNVAWVDGAEHGMAEELYLTIVPDGRTVLLEDTARLIWHVAADGATNVVEEVADLVGLPAGEVERDVNDFLADLTGRGLLLRSGEPTGPSHIPDHVATGAGPVGGTRKTPLAIDRSSVDKVRRHVTQRADQAYAIAARRLGPTSKAAPWDGDPRIALLTVNFSTTRYLKLMLLTLAEQEDLDLLKRIVICDNGSRDDAEPFLTELESRIECVRVTRNARPLSHARGMRSALGALREAEEEGGERANILLFCDTDVLFRNPRTLRTLARRFQSADVAFVGELRRHLFPYPEAQASFLAVRRDWAERRRTAPWVDHGSPAYWMQRSIWRQGGRGDDFPSNVGGYVLHRGRAGVAAAQAHIPSHHLGTVTSNTPHFMAVHDGAAIWRSIEDRQEALIISDTQPSSVVAVLAEALRSTT